MNVRLAGLVIGSIVAFGSFGWDNALAAQDAGGDAKKGPPACVPPPSCTPPDTVSQLSFPAGALSFGSPATAFTQDTRGLRWDGTDGVATLTIERPPGYADGDVRVRIFQQVLDDSSGDIAFVVTPVSFSHGSSFETYGDELTTLAAAPESPGTMLEHEAVLHAGTTGYQWPPSGDWWYFEIRRAGSFTGPLQLMSVSVEY